MSAAAQTAPNVPYNNYFIPEKDLKYVPPYLRDVPETTEEVKCESAGTWPSWLEGTFLRIGAGRFTIPLSEDGSKPNAVLQHFFDGLGMLHKFRMSNCEVHYTSRYTAEGVVRKAKKNGYVSTIMFGLNANTPLKAAQDPCSALLGAQQSMFFPTGFIGPDEMNLNVVPRRGMHLPPDDNPYSRGEVSEDPATEEVLVHTDFNMLQTCDAKTLQPKRLLTYAQIDSRLEGFGICAHPPKDRARGLTFNYIISPDGQTLSIFSLDIRANPAAVVWKTPLPCRPCYVHSLAMTDKYVVFIRNPIHMDVSDMTKPVMEMLIVEPDTPTQFFVLDKFTGEHIATYEDKDGFMFFHSVNAYDFTDPSTGRTNIHVDLCSYKDDYIPYREYNFSNVVDPAGPYQDGTLTRYELAGVDATTPSEIGIVQIAATIPGMASELPRIAKSASAVPGYRYVYCTSGNGGASPGTSVPIGRLGKSLKVVQAAFFGSLAKSDWKTGTFKRWQPKDGESCPCEPVFVQRPGATEEDDGVVLTIVIDREGTRSILVALDGSSFEEVARAYLPQVYAIGPHGSFVEGTFGV
ncbi:carotenoid oxygenase [Plectosphaerella plurivora]|uniref:Carotenoid oxygenase n=1 Tax=Plectosphaerella plurivora TaxID=936078 RepID=A0A9P9AFP3_9PEZI|nr:carotenoid oxygenase [Plectosphaerella plurivora]